MSRSSAAKPSPIDPQPNLLGLVDEQSLAVALGISLKTLRRWRVLYALPSSKRGRRRFYDPQVVRARLMDKAPDRRRRRKG
jgi:hypothetical protein